MFYLHSELGSSSCVTISHAWSAMASVHLRASLEMEYGFWFLLFLPGTLTLGEILALYQNRGIIQTIPLMPFYCRVQWNVLFLRKEKMPKSSERCDKTEGVISLLSRIVLNHGKFAVLERGLVISSSKNWPVKTKISSRWRFTLVACQWSLRLSQRLKSSGSFFHFFLCNQGQVVILRTASTIVIDTVRSSWKALDGLLDICMHRTDLVSRVRV